MGQWFYAQGVERCGPISEDALRDMLRRGVLEPQAYVFGPGFRDWIPAMDIPGFVPPHNQESMADPDLPGAAEEFGVPVEPVTPAYPQYVPPVQYGPPPAPAYGAQWYAGFWKRVAALLLDWLILLIPMLALGLALGMALVFSGADVTQEDAQFLGNLLGVVAWWLYNAGMESSRHQGSLGKMALGIMVTDAYGRPITFARATGRHFAKILSALTLGIGFIMAGLTDRKQGLHDLVADCLVVNRQPR